MTTICVVCERVKPDDTGATEPDLCGAECRADWEASLQVEVDPEAQCGTVNGTNGAGWVYVPAGSAVAERQQVAVRIANATGFVSVGALRAFYPHLSPEALRQTLKAVEAQGHVEAQGDKRGRVYVPAGDGMEPSRDVIGERGVEAVRNG